MNPKEKQKLNQAMTLLEDWFIEQDMEPKHYINSHLVAKAYGLLTEINDNVRILVNLTEGEATLAEFLSWLLDEVGNAIDESGATKQLVQVKEAVEAFIDEHVLGKSKKG